MTTLAEDAKALKQLYAGIKFLDGEAVDEEKRWAFVTLLAEARPAMLAKLTRVVVALSEALPKMRREHGEGSMIPGDPMFPLQRCNPDDARQAATLLAMGRPACFCGAAAHNAECDRLQKMLDEEG